MINLKIFVANAITLNRKPSIIFIIIHFHLSFFITFIYLSNSVSCFYVFYLNWQYLLLFLWILVIALPFIYILIWKLSENRGWLNSVTRLVTAHSSAILHEYIIVEILKLTILSSFLFFLFLSTAVLAVYVALSLVEKKSLRV